MEAFFRGQGRSMTSDLLRRTPWIMKATFLLIAAAAVAAVIAGK